jgi:pyrophosphate--fructose-6-phosphate 1-phosphotransferase
MSFGFDTACKVYSELIGNISRDALSAKKYYHFIKLMGRSASHIALECALSTHPNYVIIGEEVEKEKKTLLQITHEIADMICKRSEKEKNYGVILIPEGLIEFIPEMKELFKELNQLLAAGSAHEKKIEGLSSEEKISYVESLLSAETKNTFHHLPIRIQQQLLLDRDPHGNVQVSRIETERLLIETVSKELKARKEENKYTGKFSALHHFFGYEGRACLPSNFDAQYCYALGYFASILINHGLTGYMSCIHNLVNPASEWQAKGIPITMLMNLETRHGKQKPVIKKALVELDSKPFLLLCKHKKQWEIEDHYRYPGPIQYNGAEEYVESIPFVLNN